MSPIAGAVPNIVLFAQFLQCPFVVLNLPNTVNSVLLVSKAQDQLVLESNRLPQFLPTF